MIAVGVPLEAAYTAMHHAELAGNVSSMQQSRRRAVSPATLPQVPNARASRAFRTGRRAEPAQTHIHQKRKSPFWHGYAGEKKVTL